ncbi:anaerobic ribonucleoside-triphosphate reductase activating protein [Salinispira pacifica]|uniref:Ribonucleotide reductase of class III (Anaerobic), activating protein n=1 Tax=Salinispira pacifica TaxID=1307761 RepID=V5WM18_9SPIO|nr:anaerobic ribonucleoside-triphosphate reductase activating protein [Salinispira pacifica]AHC16660.1 Ribonucleotide reductase of class III (anaerobic), activating protein [Salinispira pacifica]
MKEPVAKMMKTETFCDQKAGKLPGISPHSPHQRSDGLSRLGFYPTSLVDFPGRVASVLFTAGCPLACPYCHNAELIHGRHPESFLSMAEVLTALAARRNRVSHVVISGGEPLVHPGLYDFIDELADIGMSIKLDTSGVLPSALEKVLNHPALVYVAMDVKTTPSNYALVGGKSGMGKRVLESLRILRAWKDSEEFSLHSTREYELRTVCAPGIINEIALKEISELLNPGEKWTLSRYKGEKVLDPEINELPMLSEEQIVQLESCWERHGCIC